MTKQELVELQKRGKIIVIENKSDSYEEQSQNTNSFKEYEGLLNNLRRIKKPVSSEPTFTPRNFFDQFQFYVNGATRRLYIYTDNSWHYINFTA